MAQIFYIAAVLLLSIGLLHTLKPIFVPLGTHLRINGNDAHDTKVRIAISLSALLAFSSHLGISMISEYFWAVRTENDLFSKIFLSIFSTLITVLVYGLIFSTVYFLLLSWLNQKIKKRISIRPIHCQGCKKALVRINSKGFLNTIERVAERTKNLTFEAYICRECSTEINRETIHLRAYVLSSDEFNFCENCHEFTMIKTASKTLRAPGAYVEGERLVT